MTAHPQGRLPGRRARHAPAPRDQVDAQGNADDRRSAADPICRRRSARGGDRADDLRHRARQGGARWIISTSASSLRRRCDGAGKSLDPLEPSRADFGEIVAVRQQQPLGLGHAVWCARHIVGDEPFAVLLPDDLMVGKPGALKQMVDAYATLGGNHRLRRGSAGRQDRQLRHHHPGRERRRADRSPRPGRKARSPPTRRRGSA